jgi:hypothetical protein
MKSPPPAVLLRLPPAAPLLCAAVLGYLPRLLPETLPPACLPAVNRCRFSLPRCLPPCFAACLPYRFTLPGFALHFARCLPPLQWLASPKNQYTSTCPQNPQKSLKGAKK